MVELTRNCIAVAFSKDLQTGLDVCDATMSVGRANSWEAPESDRTRTNRESLSYDLASASRYTVAFMQCAIVRPRDSAIRRLIGASGRASTRVRQLATQSHPRIIGPRDSENTASRFRLRRGNSREENSSLVTRALVNEFRWLFRHDVAML